MRDIVISIKATLAEQEPISISDRTKGGIAEGTQADKKLV